ncbi:glucosaminidase domain-containing protein [Desulfospira joergensenii]|uniref:glucosaminidase domain-containing protein n=1 Tax=Desulfospira joergensenii TaxID=53329 RepID=UPI0003B5339E|nr:glucosaminidase domain-containing protein [Desulfospira joergensenii]
MNNGKKIENRQLNFRPLAFLALGVLVSLAAFSSCEKKTPLPPDFGAIKDTDQKKQVFFAFLSPIVRAENKRINARRDRLLKVYETLGKENEMSFLDRGWLEDLAESYGVVLDGKVPSAADWDILLRRVDTVPRELVLVQAAIESAWGTSRFAREGNNFFGEHCTAPGCGMIPEARPLEQKWEVAVFASPAGSVRSYLHNLNTHDAYTRLRKMRAEMRNKGKTPDGVLLARALEDYSERGHEYVRDVQAMIQANQEEILK